MGATRESPAMLEDERKKNRAAELPRRGERKLKGRKAPQGMKKAAGSA